MYTALPQDHSLSDFIILENEKAPEGSQDLLDHERDNQRYKEVSKDVSYVQ